MSEPEVLEFLKAMNSRIEQRLFAIDASIEQSEMNMGRHFTTIDLRLGKIENDIRGLMEILVGLAGTLQQVGDRVRHLEEQPN